MSLGLRRHLIDVLKRVEPVLWPLFLVAVVVAFFTFPVFDARKRYFSENNLQANLAELVPETTANVDAALLEINGTFVVEGSRAVGTDKLLLVVNSEKEVSRKAALVLARSMAQQRFLSLDVEVVIAPPSRWAAEALKASAAGFFRAAVVLDVGCVKTPLCVDTIGNEGLQPNLDIVNVLTSNLALVGIQADVVCSALSEIPSLQAAFAARNPVFETLRGLSLLIPVKNPITQHQYLGYFDYLLRSATHRPDPLMQLRDRGIHTVVLRSDGACAEHHLPLARSIERLLRSVNNLNERLHHSFFTWFPMDADTFIDFEASQIVIVLGAGALLARIYRELQAGKWGPAELAVPVVVHAVGWSAVGAAHFLSMPIAALGACAAAQVIACALCGWRSSWVASLYSSTICLCLFMSLHPALGKIFSVVAPMQLALLPNRGLSMLVCAATASLLFVSSGVLQRMIVTEAPALGQVLCLSATLSNAVLGVSRVVALKA